MASSLPLNTEKQLLLPEIWHHIWSLVDFETLQKSCVAVSKTWFNGIRDSPTLSSEMKIKKGNEELSNEDFNGILSKWPKLKILDLSEFKEGKIKQLISTNKINLKALPLLEKIVAKPESLFGLGSLEALHDIDFGEVEKIWLDPNDVQAPIKLENVFWLRLYIYVGYPEESIAKMQEIGTMMTNIENLTIGIENVSIVNQGTLSWISNLTNLKKIQLSFDLYAQPIKVFLGEIATILRSPYILMLERDCTIYCSISSMIDMINALGTMKDLQILDCAILEFNVSCYDLDEQETKGMYEKAMKIIDQKLPNETITIYDYDYEFEMKKEKNQPCQLTSPPTNLQNL